MVYENEKQKISDEVTVVIPSYNRAHLLPKTIPSYIQDFVGEVLVIDDASKDETEVVIGELQKIYPKIRYIKLKENRGQPYANNLGIHNAKYPYIYFGDDDSLLMPNTISNLLHALLTGSIDVAGAKPIYLMHRAEEKKINTVIKKHQKRLLNGYTPFFDYNTVQADWDVYCKKVTIVYALHACVMLRTELAHKVMFDTRLKGNFMREDTDFIVGCMRQGAILGMVPEAYQVNLPRNICGNSGCHSINQRKRRYYNIVNTAYFYNKHYIFLKEKGIVTWNKYIILFRYIYHVLKHRY